MRIMYLIAMLIILFLLGTSCSRNRLKDNGKALTQQILTEEVHLAQALNYLTAYQIEKGLLINFGSNSLEVKRLFRKH